jgi:hypothetical protein
VILFLLIKNFCFIYVSLNISSVSKCKPYSLNAVERSFNASERFFHSGERSFNGGERSFMFRLRYLKF